jgi:LysR family glycine cleavage system transcriptional activator
MEKMRFPPLEHERALDDMDVSEIHNLDLPMAHLPSLQTLRAFEAAERLQSYSRAAEELGLTHGAVSHRIRELEQQVGVTLFQRVGNTMVATLEGRQLVGKVRQSLSVLEQAFAVPRAPTDAAARRHVVIASAPSIGATWLFKRLAEFRATHPGIDIDMRVSDGLSDYKKEKIDLGIRLGLGGWAGLNAAPMFDEAISPVCSPDYRDSMGLRTPADLARATLLRNVWTPWVTWFAAAGLDWPEPATGSMFDNSPLMLSAARDSQGVALGRHWLVIDELRAGRLVAPFDISVRDDFQYWLAWPAGRSANADAVLLREWLAAKAAAETHPCVLG